MLRRNRGAAARPQLMVFQHGAGKGGARVQPEPRELGARCDLWFELKNRGVIASVERVYAEYAALRRHWQRAGYARWPKAMPLAPSVLLHAMYGGE